MKSPVKSGMRYARLTDVSIALALAVVATGRVSAQPRPLPLGVVEAADTRARGALVAAADERRRLAGDSAAAARLAWAERQTLDTVTLAGVRWRVAPAARAPLTGAVAEVDSIMRAIGLPPFADALGTADAWILPEAPPARRFNPKLAGAVLSFDRRLGSLLGVGRPARDTLRRILASRVTSGLASRYDAPLKRFLMSAVPLERGVLYDASDLRQSMIAAGDRRGPRCAAGDLQACQSVLFDSTMRAVVGGGLRAGVVRVALEMGGRTAWPRLVADTTQPIAARLEAAAGQPLPAILTRWYAEELALPPARPVFTAAFVLGLAALSSLRGLRRAR